jgi:hypothetical protein
MKQIINSITNKLNASQAAEQQVVKQHCNYQNNYYGDQACIAHPVSKK